LGSREAEELKKLKKIAANHLIQEPEETLATSSHSEKQPMEQAMASAAIHGQSTKAMELAYFDKIQTWRRELKELIINAESFTSIHIGVGPNFLLSTLAIPST